MRLGFLSLCRLYETLIIPAIMGRNLNTVTGIDRHPAVDLSIIPAQNQTVSAYELARVG